MAFIPPTRALTMGFDWAYLKTRSPPDAPTGYYDYEINSDPANDRESHSEVTNIFNRIKKIQTHGVYIPDPQAVGAFLDAATHPDAIDDRKGAFAEGLNILARLDPNTDLAKKLNNSAINELYNTVPHPPASYLGPTYSFRQADGGGNNPQNPDMGRAGTPYARSVQGKNGLPRTSLPDPGLIFDEILQSNGVQNHTGGMSSLIFAFASIVTHSLFRTDHNNIHINQASSYLDLSPVYGDNQAVQDTVRNKPAGRGLLFPDTFSEERLLFLPPATSVLLVLFSRNHNYIAEKILKINERKTWSDPPPSDPAALALQDEEIFQTARLINCGHFMSAILGDYVASFLGSSEGLNWDMDALDVIDTKALTVERGRGNHVSVEFNMVYRWHATISAQDATWTEGVFNSAFSGKPFNRLTMQDIATFSKVFDDVAANPAERTFFGIKRGPDGRFSDDDLADILRNATEAPAGAFRGRGTPGVLRLVEIMGIEQSRAWGLCTMNEFRKFLGLKQFESFEEWNPDPAIAAAARRLYGHVDNLELYTGLQAESTMPITDGSRFANGYTITRGVLGDAIALIRGDRFYTSDFTPTNLTTWGFYDCQRDMNNGARGGQIPKLLLRNLPRHYPWNSVYSLYPFFTPDHMKSSLTRQGIADKYIFGRPETLPIPKILNTFTSIKAVWNDSSKFKVIYEKFGYGSILMFDDPAQHDSDKAMVLHALFPDNNSLNKHAAWVATSVKDKIQKKSWKYSNTPGKYIDISKDVINAVAAHFAADKITGIPLKTKDNPSGAFTENEMFDMLATLFSITFLAFDEPETRFALHEAAAQAGTMIGALAGRSLIEVAPTLFPGLVGLVTSGLGTLRQPFSPKPPWYPFLRSLAATGRPLDQLVGNILGIAVGGSVNWSHGAANVIDFYLDDARTTERNRIVELVKSTDPTSATLLRGYVCEAMRLKPQFSGLWREAVVDIEISQGPELPTMQIKAGDRIRGSFRNAHLNPLEFLDPTTVNPSRPFELYNLNGLGFHNCPGVAYSIQTITEIVKAVFSLKNVRRAPGDAGKMQQFSQVIYETETDFFIQRNGTVGPWPGTMYLAYDD